MRMLILTCLILGFIIESTDAGVSFIRWGRTVCPQGSHRLYKGYTTGKDWNKPGSGVNYLCAHEEPQFVRSNPGRGEAYSGILRGVELDLVHLEYQSLFKSENVPGGVLHNQDLPCARCYVADASDQMMIPGRVDCGNTGYDLMYHGYLVSQAQLEGHQAGEYICLDESPEGRVGGSGEDNNAVVYPVQVECGSLPCNPYVDGMEVTCAVCTY